MFTEKKLKSMLRNYKIWIFVLFLIISGSVVWGGEITDEKDSWDNYSMLMERNIFSRRRGRTYNVVKDSNEPKKIPVVVPESYFVLKGIVRQNEEYIAFFEDTRAGQTIKARAGDSIARGRLKSLTLDYIQFDLDANTTQVVIGDTLQGKLPSPVLTYDALIEWSESSSQGTTSTASGEGEEQVEGAEDILKKLMERRRRELGNN